MRRIVIANDRLKGGGVENVMDNLVRYLVEQEYEVTLMIPNCTEKEIQAHFGNRVKAFSALRDLRSIKKYSLAWFLDRAIYVLESFLFRLRSAHAHFDIAIALKEGPMMRMVSRMCAKKRIAWIHTDYNYMHWSADCFKSAEEERHCMQAYEKVICVSDAVRESVRSTIGDPGNLCVCYNPIDWRQIRAKSQEICEAKRQTDGPLFVSVGRLAYPKNYALLIDVCRELSKSYPFALWIVGDGSDREELQRKIDTCGLECVKILGEKKNPFPYIRQADVFISTSLVESYGIAVQEALVLGKPVIAVACPALEETVDREFGMLTENTFDSLKTAMESMMRNPEKLAEYRAAVQRKYAVEGLFETRLQQIEDTWKQ